MKLVTSELLNQNLNGARNSCECIDVVIALEEPQRQAAQILGGGVLAPLDPAGHSNDVLGAHLKSRHFLLNLSKSNAQ